MIGNRVGLFLVPPHPIKLDRRHTHFFPPFISKQTFSGAPCPCFNDDPPPHCPARGSCFDKRATSHSLLPIILPLHIYLLFVIFIRLGWIHVCVKERERDGCCVVSHEKYTPNHHLLDWSLLFHLYSFKLLSRCPHAGFLLSLLPSLPFQLRSWIENQKKNIFIFFQLANTSEGATQRTPGERDRWPFSWLHRCTFAWAARS